MSADDYGFMFDRPCDVELMTGEDAGTTIRTVEGFVLLRSEVDAWGERAVRHMVDSGYMHRVPMSATSGVGSVKELASPSMGVNERDGVSDVPIAFGPTGHPFAAAEEPKDADEPAEEEPAVEGDLEEFPVSLGDNEYQLSDGTTVKGRAKAARAQAALEA